jgi:hypothetical protein
MRHFRLLISAAFVASALRGQTAGRPDPAIQKMLTEISRDRIAATMQKLASFDTRGNFSDPDQKDRGIGAARHWIFDQFKSLVRASTSLLTRTMSRNRVPASSAMSRSSTFWLCCPGRLNQTSASSSALTTTR